MSKKKKVLYFVPDNPFNNKAGNITRFVKMLDYFSRKSEEFDVDFITERFWGNWNDESIRMFADKYPTINLVVLDRKIDRKKFLSYIFKYKIWEFIFGFAKNEIDLTTYLLKFNFKKYTGNKNYDFAIISYVNWGSLIKNLKSYKTSIIDTHDFITGQYLTTDKGKKSTSVPYRILEKEVGILKKFDEIWTYSVEEKYIFEQFTQKPVQLVPVSFPNRKSEFLCNKDSRKLFYVASNNDHNIRSVKWFLKEVLQHINKDIEIVVAGNISKYFSGSSQVIKLGVVEDLKSLFVDAKVFMCPMLSGTGIKIKVVEALSYGMPVVTNIRGIDGLFNKKQNGCIVASSGVEFANEINRLFSDENYYKKIQSEGESYFLNNHNEILEEEFLNHSLIKD